MIKTSQSFANEETFQLYIKYLAMKKHFTTDGYDYQKYRGKVRAKFETYRTRNDVFFFHKLSTKDEPINQLLANMVVNPNSWIRDIVEDIGDERYVDWRKKMDALSYTFKSDLNKLDDNYQANFVTTDGQHPHILRLYLQKQISLETFTIITNLSNIFPYWDDNLVDKIVARDIIRLSKKYRPFLEINEKKFKDIIRDRFF